MIMKNINEQKEFQKERNNYANKVKHALDNNMDVSEVLGGLSLMPVDRNILVVPYKENPYRGEIRKSGLKIGQGDKAFRNPESGEMEQLQSGIIVARVMEVGSNCIHVKVGDDIYYTAGSQIPVPFFSEGFYLVPEQRVMVIINDDSNLKERFNK